MNEVSRGFLKGPFEDEGSVSFLSRCYRVLRQPALLGCAGNTREILSTVPLMT